MTNRFFPVTLIVLCCIVYIATGQQNSVTITLTDALSLAQRNDPMLATARLDVETGDANVREAYSAAFPNISASGSMTRFMSAPTTQLALPEQEPMRIRMTPILNYSSGLSIQQPLWLAGKIGLGLKAAKTYRRIARTSLGSSQASLKSQIVQGFYGLMLVREVVAVTEETLQQAARNAATVQRMYDVGMSSEFDLLRAQVAVRSLGPELVNARKNAELAEVRLIDRLGLDPSTDLILDGELTELPLVSDVPTSTEAYQQALNNRPEFQVFDLQNQLYGIALEAEQRSIYWPNFFFVMNYQREAQQDVFELPKTYWSESFTWTFQASIPLFDGFATQSRVQKAQIDLRRVSLQRLQLEQGIRLEVTNAVTELHRAEEQVASHKATVELAEKAFRIAQTRYEQGVGTELEVLDSQLSLKSVRLGYLQGLYDLRVAEAEYARIVENDDNLGEVR